MGEKFCTNNKAQDFAFYIYSAKDVGFFSALTLFYPGIIIFGMHAILMSTNILQHCPDGRNNHVCSGGDIKTMCLTINNVFHIADESDRSLQLLQILTSVQNGALFKFHRLGQITPVGPREFTCKLVQYFENLHFI